MQIYIREALEQLKTSPRQINAVMIKLDKILNSTEIDHRAMSRDIQKQLAYTKLLKKYSESLVEIN